MLYMPHVIFLANLGKYSIGNQVLYEQLLKKLLLRAPSLFASFNILYNYASHKENHSVLLWMSHALPQKPQQ